MFFDLFGRKLYRFFPIEWVYSGFLVVDIYVCITMYYTSLCWKLGSGSSIKGLPGMGLLVWRNILGSCADYFQVFDWKYQMLWVVGQKAKMALLGKINKFKQIKLTLRWMRYWEEVSNGFDLARGNTSVISLFSFSCADISIFASLRHVKSGIKNTELILVFVQLVWDVYICIYSNIFEVMYKHISNPWLKIILQHIISYMYICKCLFKKSKVLSIA